MASSDFISLNSWAGHLTTRTYHQTCHNTDADAVSTEKHSRIVSRGSPSWQACIGEEEARLLMPADSHRNLSESDAARSSWKRPTVSVILPVLNEAAQLGRCLRSVAARAIRP